MEMRACTTAPLHSGLILLWSGACACGHHHAGFRSEMLLVIPEGFRAVARKIDLCVQPYRVILVVVLPSCWFLVFGALRSIVFFRLRSRLDCEPVINRDQHHGKWCPSIVRHDRKRGAERVAAKHRVLVVRAEDHHMWVPMAEWSKNLIRSESLSRTSKAKY